MRLCPRDASGGCVGSPADSLSVQDAFVAEGVKYWVIAAGRAHACAQCCAWRSPYLDDGVWRLHKGGALVLARGWCVDQAQLAWREGGHLRWCTI